MAVQRGISGIFVSILGIFILLIAVVVIAKVLGSDAPIKPIIQKSIELRKATGSVERASLISSLDDLIVQSDNEEVQSQWDRMTSCLSSSCPDEAYLDLILVVVANFESEIPESNVLINIIATAKYWDDSEHLLDFSRALSIANDQIDELDSKKARKAWDSVVECDNVCPEKFDLYFDLIEAVVQ